MFTRFIYPLYLRERISHRVQKFYSNIDDKNIPLEFNRNITLDLSKTDFGHKSIIFNGYYELGLSKTMVKLGRKGGLLVDVGANYGYFSCLWAAQNPKNKVFAFEASPVNVEPLRHNIGKNKLNDRIEIVPIAMGKEKGKLKFNLENEEKQTGWGGFTIDQNNATSVEVEVDTLDNYMFNNGSPEIEVLKIDTEGADTWVLYGAKKLLEEKKIKHIYFEHNRTRMKLLNIGENEAVDFLRSHDYVVKSLSPSDFYAYPR